MFKFNFTNRNEYFQQKAEWLVHYQEAIKNLHKAKLAIKNADRSGGITFPAYVDKKNAAKEILRLLEERWESRKEANRQWTESRKETSL